MELADAFVSYETTMVGATREVRMSLLYSPLEDLWAEVLGIFAANGPEARELLLLIVDRFPVDPMLRDSEMGLIEAWLANGIRNDDPSIYEWLAETAQSNPKLLRVAQPAVGYLGLDPI